VPALRDYLRQLQRSFGAAYTRLEMPRIARRAVIVLVAIHSGLLAYSAYVHSPTMNEPGHLVAGLSHWEFGRFDLYSVNPPLVKMVAALPVIAVGYEEDWSGFYSGPGARPEFAMGEDFVAANGERSFFLFMIARWVCIPFSWIGATVCYLWARDLYGRPAGVMACAIWCFEPNILAHASLMTPDAHATSLGLAACYTFWRWLKKPTWSQAALTGIVLGLAELAKTTLILFYPLWPLMWIVYRWPERQSMAARDWLREAGMLLARMAIGLYVLNLGYGFESSLKPLGDFRFVSNLFTGDTTSRKDRAGDTEGLSYNRFDGTWLTAVPVPFPANYLIGIDLQQYDFEEYGRPSYLRGQWRDHGWWYYYLYAVAIKVPLGLFVLAVFILISRRGGDRRDFPMPAEAPALTRHPLASIRDELMLLLPPLVVFAVVSAKTGFNEHMRYVLPCFPFIFIWISSAARNFVDKAVGLAVNYPRPGSIAFRRFARPLSLALLLWSFASSLWIYPHSLNYFNESIGGPICGPKHLLGSNVDWGQDLFYLKRWIDTRTVAASIRIQYYGGSAPTLDALGIELPTEGWHRPEYLAVSIASLAGERRPVWDLDGVPFELPSNWFQVLRNTQPISIPAYSIRNYVFPMSVSNQSSVSVSHPL
jgi:hypothetical protein